jgi:thiol-disulfide isomerase/thioredoxin
MRHPVVISHGLLIATALLFWVSASASRLQAAEGTPSATVAPAPAPAAERTVLAAADFELADHAGRIVMLDFWASWCKPCKQSMPWLSQLQRAHGEKGLQIVAISVDTEESAMRSMLGVIDPGIIVVFDPEGVLARQYNLEAMPTSVMIDRAGKVLSTHVGFREAEIAAREAEVAALLAAEHKSEKK